MSSLPASTFTNSTNTCRECGAQLLPGKSCQETFEDLLALEFSNPDYGKVHFLTVTCYMIQHRRYSDHALTWMEAQLRKFLEGEVPSRHQVREMGFRLSQQRRQWKVNRQAGDTPLVKISWSMTISDVAKRYTDAQSYCALVDRWARSTLAEMQPQLAKPA